MSSIDDKSKDDERIIFQSKLHWAVLLGPILVIVIGGLAARSQGYHAVALIVFGLIWGIVSYIDLQKSVIQLTQNNVKIDNGFPLKKPFKISLNDIILIDYYQPSLGSMLNFGKIIIIDKRKKKRVFRFISSPIEFVKEVRNCIIALTPSSPDSRTS